LKAAFDLGEFDVLAMTRMAAWPIKGEQATAELRLLRDQGLPIYFALDRVLTTSEDGWDEMQRSLRRRSGPPRLNAPKGIDPELWQQEAGWRDFRKNWPWRR
jgi:hypothetical protein